VARLIGAPPGYVGYEEGGRLTEAIRRRPYSVILFDEVEKAHRDVFNILLQVFDDGRLTDGHGRTVDFKNTIIAMTSNIASQWIQDLTGPENEEELRRRVKQALKEAFRPEFLNRIDETIIFHGLSKEMIGQIAEIQLKELQKRLSKNNYRLTVADRVKEQLVQEGFDPHFGARPLKRTIQQMIENPLSMEILEGKFAEGTEIRVDMENGKMVFAAGELVAV
jgi:ATP-dependent Clp protease ATP-binding subunit ClpB